MLGVQSREDSCVRAQSCLTLCHALDSSPPGSSVHGILQVRILEWIGISFSRGSNPGLLLGRRILYHWATREEFIGLMYYSTYNSMIILISSRFSEYFLIAITNQLYSDDFLASYSCFLVSFKGKLKKTYFRITDLSDFSFLDLQIYTKMGCSLHHETLYVFLLGI